MSLLPKYRFNRIIYLAFLVIACGVLVSPFFFSIFFAATISLAIYPLQLRLEARGLGKRTTAALLTCLFFFTISLPFTVFIVKGTMAITGELERFLADGRLQDQGVQNIVRNIRHDILDGIHGFTSNYEVLSFITLDRIEYYFNSASGYILKFFQQTITGLPVLFLLLLVTVLCIYSMLKHAGSIRVFFQAAFGFSDEKMDKLVTVFMNDTRQVYVANIMTGATQSLVVASGVYFTGQGEFFLVFFVTLILSFIPVVGTAPVAFLFALVAFLKGDTTASFILVGVGVFAGLVDNVLRPYFNSLGENHTPPIVSFVCVIGGALLLGFPGLFVGILMGNIAYNTIPLFWKEISYPRGGNRPRLRRPAPAPELIERHH